MTIIYISDFDLAGSGYMNLSVALCNQLAQNGYEVLSLGLGYNGQEHHYPFKIVPAELPQLVPMIKRLSAVKGDVEAVVVALDIPLQEKLLQLLDAPGELPYIGIFPLEAGPLCQTWALSLLRMDARLIMSRFGQAELEAVGVDSEFIPIGIDAESWRPPEAGERERLREGLGVDDDTFIVLTVADNQERKNLSRAMEIFADFSQDHKAVYWLVTRPELSVGWKLQDLALELGILDKINIWRRGISFKELWSLYAAADCFLLTSKAEGLAMPILEAMACRLPAIGTQCAAIEEHLSDGRGLLIKPDYTIIDPFGNGRRYMASREDGVYQLKLLRTGMSPQDRFEMLNRAQAYVGQRNWDKAGAVLIKAIENVKRTKNGETESKAEAAQTPELIPA